jgi:hypothetical protein
MTVTWKSFKVTETEGDWEPGAHNFKASDGNEYGSWSKTVRQHEHGLTMLHRIKAPPGKAWKVVGKAPELGEEVYILEGAYYDTSGRVIVGPGTFMFNAPGAIHGGIQRDMLLMLHWCSGKPDEIVSRQLIDFEPTESV